MKLRIATIISTCLVVLPLALAGCDEQSEKTAAEAGTVKASPAYLEHFGQPPTPEEGTCFARVGFYSLRDDPDKIRAVPFFLYRETGQLQQLLERLVSGAVPLPPESGLVSPFPEETSVAVQSRDEGGVTLDLIFNDRQPSGQDLKAIAAVLTETAVQFEAVESVVILRDGKPLPGAPKEGYRHAPERVSAVKSPVLFMVIADWQEGQSGPEEIAANFDRPVRIETFRLEDVDGRKIEGDYYQSVFNMSVIIHPENPERIREGMTLRAHWNVVDDLGRRGQGTEEFTLQRHEHLRKNSIDSKI